MKLSYMIDQNDVFFNVKEVLKIKFQISDRLLLKLKKQKKDFAKFKSCIR